MRDNQSFNEYVDTLTNIAIVEINKRDVNNLTDEYLDGIFALALEKVKEYHYSDTIINTFNHGSKS